MLRLGISAVHPCGRPLYAQPSTLFASLGGMAPPSADGGFDLGHRATADILPCGSIRSRWPATFKKRKLSPMDFRDKLNIDRLPVDSIHASAHHIH